MKSGSCPCSCLSPRELSDNESSIAKSAQELIHILDDQNQIDLLAHWLGCSVDAGDEPPSKSMVCPSCLSSGDTTRVSIASSIILEIRNACQPLFDEQAKSQGNNIDSTPAIDVEQMMKNAEDFPSLQTSKRPTSSSPKPASKPKEKRRIRPLHMSTTVSSSSSWGGEGNLVGLATSEKDEPPAAWGSGRFASAGAFAAEVAGPHTNDDSTAVASNVLLATENPSTARLHRPASGDTHKMERKSTSNESDNHCLSNLARLYSAVLDNALCPSITNEIRFLLQCLSLTSNIRACVLGSEQKDPVFASLLTSSEQCHYFACQVLQLQLPAIRQLAVFVPKLSCSQLLQKHVPELVKSLEQTELTSARESNTTSTGTSSSRLFPEEQSVQFTLPFDRRRDSRHNFKSAVGQAMFVNREECRDAFVQQLRSFLNIRGSLLDSNAQSRAVANVRQSASQLVQNIMIEGNSAWFAEFFCDMLVQTGNAPIQETDPELLKMGDHAKVQKLHERFSAKSVRSSRRGGSTRSIMPRKPQHQRNAAPFLLSPFSAAQQHFPGHQEFFYLFLTASSHYSFSIHLRSLIATRLKESNTLCVQDKCMLARFLGVLLFSPNWCATTEGSYQKHVVDGVRDLQSLGLPLLQLLQGTECWESIPFVVELLAMSQWDVHRSESLLYRQLITLLRRLQIHLKRQGDHQSSASLLLYLDCLFGEYLGLTVTVDLFVKHMDASEITKLEPSLRIGTEGLPASSKAHLAELTTFLSQVEERSKGKHPQDLARASRKLRPSVVTTPSGSSIPSLSTVSRLVPFGGDNDPFLVLLRDSFFHRHGELKELCEIVARQSLKEVEAHARQEFSAYTAQNVSYETDIVALRSWYVEKGSSLLDSHFKDHVGGALSALGSYHVGPAAIEEATALTTAHCIQVGSSRLEAIVIEKMEQAKTSIAKLRKKRDKQQHVIANGGDPPDPLSDVCLAVQKLNDYLRTPVASPNEVDLVGFGGICLQIRETLIIHFTDPELRPLPSPAVSRGLFLATTELGERLGAFLVQIASNSCLSQDFQQRVLHDTLLTSARLAKLSVFVLGKHREALQNSIISEALQPNGLLANLLREFDEACFN